MEFGFRFVVHKPTLQVMTLPEEGGVLGVVVVVVGMRREPSF